MPVAFRLTAAQTKRLVLFMMLSFIIPAHHRTKIAAISHAIALFGLTLAIGCSTSDSSNTATNSQDSGPVESSTGQPFDGENTRTWDLISMKGEPIGYQHLTLRQTETNGALVFEGLLHTELRMRRFGEEMVERMDLAGRDDANGQIMRVEARIGNSSRIQGRRVGDRMEMEATEAGQSPRRWSIPLPADCGGYFALEWSLRKTPMKPGETRRLSSLMPVLNQVVSVELVAGQTWDDAGSLMIKNRTFLPDGNVIPGQIWMSRKGEVVRTELPSLNQTTERTTEKIAKSALKAGTFDIATASTIQIEADFPQPHDTRMAKYRITSNGQNLSELFPQTTGQRVSPIDATSAFVEVRRVEPGPSQAPEGTTPEELESALTPSLLIQADSAEIQALAANVEGETALQIALHVESLVHDLIEEKNFSTSFASAVEVARRKEGDCTEHAVLTAAICRAKNVPCRVLLGLVYVSSLKAFGFHMWNEFYDGQNWIPIDATLGRGGTGAAHLILARTPLATESGMASCLPVLRAMGQLEIELVEVEPR